MEQIVTKYRKDYTPPSFFISNTDLDIELIAQATRVKSSLQIKRNPENKTEHICLDGEELELISVKLNSKQLTTDEYTVNELSLTIHNVPDEFTLEIENIINPEANTQLSGLYLSSGNFCTQCEAEGFRRITYYLDRPDVMAEFTTKITADQKSYPILLSNGNKVASGELDNGKHWVEWHDISKKPCYLFALVAGDLYVHSDEFMTMSGRKVVCQVIVEPRNKDQTSHAMQCLKNAMAWDEKVFEREYDLDIYMIVAVDDFNMGAMENKGLNIFNSKFILAKPSTATDRDYHDIEAVIGHEYFHNWTGNRITCQDWFQLSLKEGLTIFREQEFSSDQSSRLVQRINDVNVLRREQFTEDSGPTAHPVRPDSYIEINNFYTVTIYEKGSEVIRMQQTLLGKEGFKKGMDLYFQRHDGQAVTIEDFVTAMEDANDADFTQLRLWYSQAGTPVVYITPDYNLQSGELTLTVKQTCPPTPGQKQKRAMHMPIVIGFVDYNGDELTVRHNGVQAKEFTLELRAVEQKFVFSELPEKSIPSLLRNFSAPVKLHYPYTSLDLSKLSSHDTDGFNRWEAMQRLATNVILDLINMRSQQRELSLPEVFQQAFTANLSDPSIDHALRKLMLTLPEAKVLYDSLEVIDVDAVHECHEFISKTLASDLRDQFLELRRSNVLDKPYSPEQNQAAIRGIRNLCLDYLMKLNDPAIIRICVSQFNKADNLTDQLAALNSIINIDCTERKLVLDKFYQTAKDVPLVLDQWFSIQARSTLPGALDRVKQLMTDPGFSIKNPNRVRALIGAFVNGNPIHFHNIDGSGYNFLADSIIQLNAINPQIAARMVSPFSQWRRHTPERQDLMQQALQSIAAEKNLSKDVYEMVSKLL